jgi:hypothetical protein
LRNGRHWKFVDFQIVPGSRTPTRVYILDIPAMKPAEYAALISPGKHITATGDGQPTPTRRGPRFRPTGGGRP